MIESDSPATIEANPLLSPRAFAPMAGYALGLIVPAVLLLVPAMVTDYGEQWVALGLVVAAGFGAEALYYLRTPLYRTRRSVIPLVIMGVAAVVTVQTVWNIRFRAYVNVHHESQHEIFRKAFRTFYAPFYGRPSFGPSFAKLSKPTKASSTAATTTSGASAMTSTKAKTAPTTNSSPPPKPPTLIRMPYAMAAIGVALLWFLWARAQSLSKRWGWGSWVVLAGMQGLLILAFAGSEGPVENQGERLMSTKMGAYDSFRKDLPAFTGVSDTLRTYTQKMPSLGWFGQHYPPGNLILLQIEDASGLRNMTKWLELLLVLAASWPLYRVTLELGLDQATAKAAALLFASTSGVLIYTTLNTTSILVLPTALCLWGLVRALRTGDAWASVMLGAAFDFYLFFSASVSVLGLLMTLVALIGLWKGTFELKAILKCIAISLGTVVGLYAAVWLVSRFNMAACLVEAINGHHRQQGSTQFVNLIEWGYRSTGNIVAYLMSVPLLFVLAVAAAASVRKHGTPAARALVISVVAVIPIAGFSGLFYFETERIWIFLTPALAVAAAYELVRRARAEGEIAIKLVFAVGLVISVTQEIFLTHWKW